MSRGPHPADHEPAGSDKDGDSEEAEDGPVREIFEIIERYYRGLKRETEGMGVD